MYTCMPLSVEWPRAKEMVALAGKALFVFASTVKFKDLNLPGASNPSVAMLISSTKPYDAVVIFEVVINGADYRRSKVWICILAAAKVWFGFFAIMEVRLKTSGPSTFGLYPNP
jgi:6,7-dimethyl-8-ribityllumazine synthase